MGCGQTSPKSALLRIAAVDGVARTDPSARLPGRGAYACSAGCLERASNRRALSRAFRGPVVAPDDPPLSWS
ncbi:MAG: YlxR family protein [Solirubrobacteraceae bacterium]|nr:YlxR family protein [Solirubrobacteraceae bacterium]